MACVFVRNAFKLCKFRILSNFQNEDLTLSRPLFVSAACYLREGTEVECFESCVITAFTVPVSRGTTKRSR